MNVEHESSYAHFKEQLNHPTRLVERDRKDRQVNSILIFVSTDKIK